MKRKKEINNDVQTEKVVINGFPFLHFTQKFDMPSFFGSILHTFLNETFNRMSSVYPFSNKGGIDEIFRLFS